MDNRVRAALASIRPVYEALPVFQLNAWRNFAPDEPTARHVAAAQRVALHELLHSFGLDPSLAETAETNWLEELHGRIMSGLAPALVKLYIEAPPTDEEYAVITCETLSNAELNTGLSTAATRRALRESTLHSYRQRGFLVQAAPMPSFRFLIIDPIQRLVSFGIPSAAALEAIARHGPIIEVGAGTGYWAGLLQAMGVDIIAFDAEPTSTGSCVDGASLSRRADSPLCDGATGRHFSSRVLRPLRLSPVGRCCWYGPTIPTRRITAISSTPTLTRPMARRRRLAGTRAAWPASLRPVAPRSSMSASGRRPCALCQARGQTAA